jgi:hypothetical protein
VDRVKKIEVRVIPGKIAIPFIKRHHYSGKVVQNSCLHFGAFLEGKLHGVMSFGPSMVKDKLIGLVEGTKWNEFIELNRMAFDEYLPRNSESRCISIALRLLKKNAPQIKWVVSFADGCSCGDGTIYRASNFVLTGITVNKSLVELPSGEKIHKLTLETGRTLPRKELNGKSYLEVGNGKPDFKKYLEASGGRVLTGYQLRYLYFIDKTCKDRLTVPILPFSKIDELNAGMYKGQKITQKERHIDNK